MIDIFTDGSTINNGKKNALGGIGVYIPKYKYKCLSQNKSGVGKKYIVKSITLPIVSMLIIVPMKGFCFKGIHPKSRINPVITPANPILTFIN